MPGMRAVQRAVFDTECVEPGEVVLPQARKELGEVTGVRRAPRDFRERTQARETRVVDPPDGIEVLGPHLRLRAE